MTFQLGILCSELHHDRANCRKVSENKSQLYLTMSYISIQLTVERKRVLHNATRQLSGSYQQEKKKSKCRCLLSPSQSNDCHDAFSLLWHKLADQGPVRPGDPENEWASLPVLSPLYSSRTMSQELNTQKLKDRMIMMEGVRSQDYISLEEQSFSDVPLESMFPS